MDNALMVLVTIIFINIILTLEIKGNLLFTKKIKNYIFYILQSLQECDPIALYVRKNVVCVCACVCVQVCFATSDGRSEGTAKNIQRYTKQGRTWHDNSICDSHFGSHYQQNARVIAEKI